MVRLETMEEIPMSISAKVKPGADTTMVVVTLDSPEEALQLESGFRRIEPLVRAFPRDQLEPVNLDVTAAVQTVLGAYPEIVEHRPVLLTLGTFDISNVDNLRDLAAALGHAHVEYRTAGGVVDDIPQLATECLDNRDRFLTDALALAKRKFVEAARVEKIRGGNSYRMIAFDVLTLVDLFKKNWAAIEGNTGLRMAEIEDAALKANRLLTAIGVRDQSTPAANEAAVLRQQAYTMLIRAYGETRDALTFVRRAQGDADTIAPSLFAGRGGRRPGADELVPETVPPVAQPEPEPASGLTATSVPVGFPGSSPVRK
jgi:hypothetical protein